ncbi:MAG TPA: HEAT repeat domain-containing protein [Pyrinomonadaceae bacterium]|nr:HEAT repeat domain-containing protein [Pyrinomonadaceae bacterium]
MKNPVIMSALLFFLLGAVQIISQKQIVRAQGQGAQPVRQSAQDSDVQAEIQKLSSQSATEREQATCALGEMRGRAASAIPALIKMLGDATEVMRINCGGRERYGNANVNERTTLGEEAAITLVKIGAPEAVEPVIAVLGEENARARANAAWALGVLSDERTVEPLISAMRDADAVVRKNAAWGLGLKRDGRVVEPLIVAMGDSEVEVRNNAVWSLGIVGDERSVEPLVSALRDGDWKVRSQAAWSLGLRGDERAVEPLINALRDNEPGVRTQAAWALGLRGDSRAVAPLTTALRDGSADVRHNAAWALRLIKMKSGRMSGMNIRIDPNIRVN